MKQLSNKRIVLGVTGGIAAYKSAELVRSFIKAGAQVHVVMTKAACEFITPLTMQALSHNPVHLDLLDPAAEAGMGHIELARWADIVVIAPATADVMARMAGGHADDLLTTLCLATSAPICLAPAMNQAMWRDEVTQANVAQLKARGMTMFGPDDGFQACGDVGPGRMLDPDVIAEKVAEQFSYDALSGVKLIITAGGTQEAIDPVRVITNHSSGKMGYALAEAAAEMGAVVTLITAPVHIPLPERLHKVVNVVSAQQMYDAVHEHVADCELFIGCAAVSDYRPVQVAGQKIKKDPNDVEQTLTLVLERTQDIIASVGNLEQPPFIVGFAAETHDVLNYAKDKRQRKKMNMIVANNVSTDGVGFGSNANEVTLIGDGIEHPLKKASKQHIARQLLTKIAGHFRQWHADHAQ